MPSPVHVGLVLLACLAYSLAMEDFAWEFGEKAYKIGLNAGLARDQCDGLREFVEDVLDSSVHSQCLGRAFCGRKGHDLIEAFGKTNREVINVLKDPIHVRHGEVIIEETAQWMRDHRTQFKYGRLLSEAKAVYEKAANEFFLQVLTRNKKASQEAVSAWEKKSFHIPEEALEKLKNDL